MRRVGESMAMLTMLTSVLGGKVDEAASVEISDPSHQVKGGGKW
jgi:hypothetical protein